MASVRHTNTNLIPRQRNHGQWPSLGWRDAALALHHEPFAPYFCHIVMWVCLKMVRKPLNPMVLLIIIPFWNGYFIGNIDPTFSDKPMLDRLQSKLPDRDRRAVLRILKIMFTSLVHMSHGSLYFGVAINQSFPAPLKWVGLKVCIFILAWSDDGDDDDDDDDIYWWYIDDILMIYWWYIDDILMIYWWYIDDILMIYWWYIDDILMIYWWYIDDILMIYWWYIDGTLMVHWWYIDGTMMVQWWYNDDILMIYLWYIDYILMIYWWHVDDILMRYWWDIGDMLMIYWWYVDDILMIYWSCIHGVYIDDVLIIYYWLYVGDIVMVTTTKMRS